MIANQRLGIAVGQSATSIEFDSGSLFRSICLGRPKGARYLSSTNQSPELARLDDGLTGAVPDCMVMMKLVVTIRFCDFVEVQKSNKNI